MYFVNFVVVCFVEEGKYRKKGKKIKKKKQPKIKRKKNPKLIDKFEKFDSKFRAQNTKIFISF